MKKNSIIFSVALVLVLALGILMNSLIKNDKEAMLIEKEKQAEVKLIKSLLPEIDVDKVEVAAEQSFLDKDGVKIVKRYNALKGQNIVGIVYVGETKGWKDGLQVAFGIDAVTNKLTGSKILDNEETPRFYEALTGSNFFDQFKNKDMSKYLMDLTLVTGPTPNTGNSGVIAPATSNGVKRIMLLAREQYSLDTSFVMPSGLTLVSKSLDYNNINQFNYVLKLGDTNINVVVNKAYEIVSISDEAQTVSALEVININKMDNFIVSESVEGTITTLVVQSTAYSNSTLTTTIVITDKNITSVTALFSVEQSYDNDYNGDYWDGPDSGKSTSGYANNIKNGVDIDTITGATYTVNAYRNAQNILRGYMVAHNE